MKSLYNREISKNIDVFFLLLKQKNFSSATALIKSKLIDVNKRLKTSGITYLEATILSSNKLFNLELKTLIIEFLIIECDADYSMLLKYTD